MSRPAVLSLGHESESPGGFVKTQALSLSDLVGLGGNLEICMFNQLPGDAATAVGILRSTGQD